MGRTERKVFNQVHLRFLSDREDDVKAEAILQRQRHKKQFIVEAIIAYDALMSGAAEDRPEGVVPHTPPEQPGPAIAAPDDDGAHGLILDRLSSLEELVGALIEKVAAIPSVGVPVTNDVPEEPVVVDQSTGFNEDDMNNFQLARKAFGALADDDE